MLIQPKISIITATYNGAETIRSTLDSVASQSYENIEHIVVDGMSRDDTIKIVEKYGVRTICEKDSGIYDAINKGIKLSSGDIVGILNSDDFFPNERVVEKIVEVFERNDPDAVYGDVAFVKPDNLTKIVRRYDSSQFVASKFKYGYMPAHPTFYAKRNCFEKYGFYHTDYKIAADFELVMRFMYTHGIATSYINEPLVYMRTGGVSNQNIRSRLILNQEVVKACKENNVDTNLGLLSIKYVNKVSEYLNPLLGKR